MEVRSKVYTYHTEVKWTEQRKGVISCAGKPDVKVATPPEFKGHEGIQSPEDLFVASVNICLMYSYESAAEGKLELFDGKLQFTAIMLKPTITLPVSADAIKAKELIEKAEANCLIFTSMKARVSLEPTIRQQDGREQQNAENVRQQRSHLESILNVAQSLRLRCFHRLQPCWTNVLSILRDGSPVVSQMSTINALLSRNGFSAACQSEAIRELLVE